ncbi:MAG: HK97 family phage prohead protease [Candidatus Dormibacteraeota bacterium]|nr:HK97 family phage prohead protease [Candidatus Dormibacteraeota bacterium]
MSEDQDRPADGLCIRAAELLEVSFPERTIELVVIPYETEALVYQPYGRPVHESVGRGAFDGIERRANRVRVNRDHQFERTVGRAVAFHPSRQEGLVAALRIARTQLGDETLALADDGCLDASAGFRPMPGGEEWSDMRRRVRITRAWLDHIGMTPIPAYETANVLAVRDGPSPPPTASQTPNLDIYRSWRLEDLVASDPALNR